MRKITLNQFLIWIHAHPLHTEIIHIKKSHMHVNFTSLKNKNFTIND
jgi:hypothetical protein